MPTNIDLTPVNKKKSYLETLVFWLSQRGKYLLLVFNIIMFLLYIFSMSVERSNIVLLQEIGESKLEIEKLSEDALKYDTLQDIAGIIEIKSNEDVDSQFILDFLRESTPSGVTITDISSDGNTLTLGATSNNSAVFFNFLTTMKDESRFESVLLTQSSYNESSDVFTNGFTIEYN